MDSFTDCRETDDDFLNSTDSVRGAFFIYSISTERTVRTTEQALKPDTLEAVDVSLNLIQKYSDTFQLATTADEVLDAVKAGKVASLLGVEG
jgi:membrane dipeptidase